MEFVLAQPFEAYLVPAPLVDSDAPEIAAFVDERLPSCEPEEAARRVFQFVRDEVAHSWDAQTRRVTRSASDALRYREGICFPKSHLMAALLRRSGVPTAICYQRLFDEKTGRYATHALNAVYLGGEWRRIDARGNNQRVSSEFSLAEERLPFTVRENLGEVNYPTLHAVPHAEVIAMLRNYDDALVMYTEGRPSALE